MNQYNKNKYFYPLLATPLAIIAIPLYIYLPTYYSVDYGLEFAIVGLVLFLARFFDIFTDPFIGFLSDKSVEKFGTRKPLVFLGVIFITLSFCALIYPNQDYIIAWLFLFSSLIYFGWSLATIPYLTWSAEITTNYHEKTALNTSREVFTLLGTLIALLTPFIVGSITNEEKLFSIYIIFILLIVPIVLLSFKKLKIQSTIKQKSVSFRSITSIYTQIDGLKHLHIGYFINNLANAIPASLFLLFITHIIQNDSYSEIILLLYFLAGILALPFWTYLSKKIGKKYVWISSILLSCLSFLFVIFLQQDDVIAFGIISFISGLCLGADIAFPTAMQSDIAQKIKNHNSGLLFGIWTMITKFALAFSVVLSFGILSLFEFDKISPDANDKFILIITYGLLPILLKIVALFFITKFKDEFTNKDYEKFC